MGAHRHEEVALLMLEGGHEEFEAIEAHINALIAFLDRALQQNGDLEPATSAPSGGSGA